MTDRDRLIELIKKAIKEWGVYFGYSLSKGETRSKTYEEFIADYLLANGVRVIDTKFINPENRELITHFAGMPINDVLDLVKAKQEERIIVPPCKVGDTVYHTYYLFNEIIVEELKVLEVTIDNKGIRRLYGATKNGSIYCFSRDYNLNEIKFTKEEAERELQKRGEENACNN